MYDLERLSVSVMDLVLEYAYLHFIYSDGRTVYFDKIKIRLKIKKESLEEISFMIGNAIPLTTAKEDSLLTEELLSSSMIYRAIYLSSTDEKILLKLCHVY